MNKSGLAFDNIADPKDISELSVVLYADSFFYGLWDKTSTLKKTGYHPYVSLQGVSTLWDHQYNLETVKVLSAVKPYVHLDALDYEEEFFDVYFHGLYDVQKLSGYRKLVDQFSFQDIKTLHYLEPHFKKKISKSLYATPRHLSTAMAEVNHKYKKGLLCYIGQGMVHITLVDNKGFRMYNQYPCAHKLDCLYFLLMICQSLGINTASQPLFLGGDNLGKSFLESELVKYFPQLQLIGEEIKIDADRPAPQSHYYDLQICRLCG